MRALALLAALVGAVAIPGAPPGIGVVAVALLIAAAAFSTVPRSGDLLLFGAPALLLAASPALLDASWVLILDVLAAWLFAYFAVGGARLLAPLAPVAALPRVPGVLPEPSSRALSALRATVIGVALTIPFAALFFTADAAFAAIADSVPRPTADALPGRIGTFAFVRVAALSLALGARRRVAESCHERRDSPSSSGLCLSLCSTRSSSRSWPFR